MNKEQLIDKYISNHIFDSWVPSPLTCKKEGKKYDVYIVPTILFDRVINMFALTMNECELHFSEWLKKHLNISEAVVGTFYGKVLTPPGVVIMPGD